MVNLHALALAALTLPACGSGLVLPQITEAAHAACIPGERWTACLAKLESSTTPQGKKNVDAFSEAAGTLCAPADGWEKCSTKISATSGQPTEAPASEARPGSFAKPYGE